MLHRKSHPQKTRVGYPQVHLLQGLIRIEEGFIAQKPCDGEQVLVSQTPVGMTAGYLESGRV
jgi:hypothetical protein